MVYAYTLKGTQPVEREIGSAVWGTIEDAQAYLQTTHARTPRRYIIWAVQAEWDACKRASGQKYRTLTTPATNLFSIDRCIINKAAECIEAA